MSGISPDKQPAANPAYPVIDQQPTQGFVAPAQPTETQPLNSPAVAPPSYDASQRQQTYVVPPAGQPYQQPPGGAPFQPQSSPQQAPPTQVVYRVIHTSYGETSVTTQCPNCREEIRTRVKSEAGMGAWLAGLALCVFGCFCGCCLIPCCLDSMKVFTHTCPKCHNVLGKYKGAASLS